MPTENDINRKPEATPSLLSLFHTKGRLKTQNRFSDDLSLRQDIV
ncbi:hypothetical protein NEISICOT_01880 [Neisseria sicca ATCC 29256]|uniref:Uncharacterized protein n=1 Tax=Neisseria sicca ATCC 29256 TaxID=547045 RepID=C6M5T1_NEISI|nr:hypothetical protein [Neisseria sicca]EET44409.1 hypothetical protein NEISICOT_01880 [Neisseria sicca ATCC 29256]